MHERAARNARPAHGDGTPLRPARPATGVRESWPPDGPSGHARAGSCLLEVELTAVPPKGTTLVTVIIARAVTVPSWLLPAVSVRLT